jgi:hypothetical protein
MPPFFAEYGVHSQPHPFERLDAYINDNPDAKASFHDGLVAGQKEGFSAGGPFAGDTAMRDHWAGDWTDASGRGGNYWPYLTSVDIGQALADGLTTSIARARETEKLHNTIWLPLGDVPEVALRGGTLEDDEQQGLFTVAVYEGRDVVSLVILTPPPLEPQDAGD